MNFKVLDKNKNTDWDDYLMNLDTHLKTLSYIKYNQRHNNSDHIYWKKLSRYQIGVAVYDWRAYNSHNLWDKIGLSYVCMPIDLDGRADMEITLDIEISDFEKLSKVFYDSISNTEIIKKFKTKDF